MRETILLVGHGSRDPAGNAEFLEWAAAVADRSETPVEPCFIELAEPGIREGMDRCVERGAERVVVVPATLLAAGHAKLDVPREIDLGRVRHPRVDFRYGRPFGVDSLVIDILAERLAEAEAGAPPMPREQTAVLLVGRGSNDPDANGDLCKVARLVWERSGLAAGSGYGWMETCYIGVTRPDFPSGLRRCASPEVRRVIVLPYFLFTGVLVERMHRLATDLKADLGGIDIRFARHLGGHPNLGRLVWERRREAVEGRVTMSCDTCRYRAAIAEHGGGHDHGHDHHHHHHDHRDHRHDPAGSLAGEAVKP